MQRSKCFSCQQERFMKSASLLFGLSLFLTVSTLFGCKKETTNCNPTSKGRIIGYDPCRHYSTATSNVQGSGFVIEIDNDTSKDTVVTYGIPNGLFQFPAISNYAATNGWFLYAPETQNKLLIKFDYRFAFDNEKSAVLCKDNIYIAPFNSAVKGREIFITCISSR